MNDLYERTMDDLANRHLHEIELDIKNNPRFQEGMFIGLWGEQISASERMWHGYGIVRKVKWHESRKGHMHTIEMIQTHEIFEDVPDNDLSRQFFTKDETKKMMLSWRNHCGEGSGHGHSN